MYYPDLTPYAELDGVLANVYRIGWLAQGVPFQQASVSSHIVEKLGLAAQHCSVNRMRGYYCCEFCDEERISIHSEGRVVLLGSAEIWVPGRNAIVFAAPNLIVHYIARHQYSPPSEFIEAVEMLDIATFDAQALWDSKQPRDRSGS